MHLWTCVQTTPGASVSALKLRQHQVILNIILNSFQTVAQWRRNDATVCWMHPAVVVRSGYACKPPQRIRAKVPTKFLLTTVHEAKGP